MCLHWSNNVKKMARRSEYIAVLSVFVCGLAITLSRVWLSDLLYSLMPFSCQSDKRDPLEQAANEEKKANIFPSADLGE